MIVELPLSTNAPEPENEMPDMFAVCATMLPPLGVENAALREINRAGRESALPELNVTEPLVPTVPRPVKFPEPVFTVSAP